MARREANARTFSNRRLNSPSSVAVSPHDALVQGEQRFVDFFQHLRGLVGKGDEDHAAIVGRAVSANEAGFFQSIDEARNAWHHGDRAVGDFENWQRPALAPQDAQDVVLRGRQPIVAEQPAETDLQLIVRASRFSAASCCGEANGRFFLSSCCSLRAVIGRNLTYLDCM